MSGSLTAKLYYCTLQFQCIYTKIKSVISTAEKRKIIPRKPNTPPSLRRLDLAIQQINLFRVRVLFMVCRFSLVCLSLSFYSVCTKAVVTFSFDRPT